jgi:hypothetical protein
MALMRPRREEVKIARVHNYETIGSREKGNHVLFESLILYKVKQDVERNCQVGMDKPSWVVKMRRVICDKALACVVLKNANASLYRGI